MFRVFWTPDAEQSLEKTLTSSAEPRLIVTAARQLDQLLVNTGSEFGESRYESMRIGFVFPLGIQFEVLEDVDTVMVHDVWRIDHK
jgi:hypothetical protein